MNLEHPIELCCKFTCRHLNPVGGAVIMHFFSYFVYSHYKLCILSVLVIRGHTSCNWNISSYVLVYHRQKWHDYQLICSADCFASDLDSLSEGAVSVAVGTAQCQMR